MTDALSHGPRATLLIAQQRSGTGALGSLLGAHPRVAYLGEVFHPGDVASTSNFVNQIAHNPDDVTAYARRTDIDRLWNLFLERCARQFGKDQLIVDIKYDNVRSLDPSFWAPDSEPFVIRLARESSMGVVWLRRANAVRTYVSGIIASRSGVWHAQVDPGEPESVSVDPRDLIGHLNYSRRMDNYMREVLNRGIAVVELEYADLFDASGRLSADSSSRLEALFAVGPGEFANLVPATYRQGNLPLSRLIVNFDEVAESLLETEMLWMLLDEENQP